MEIVGFSHDDLTGGEKAPYTFGMKNLMADTRKMNSIVSQPIFSESELYGELNGSIYNGMDSDLKSVIKPALKRTGVGLKSSSVRVESMLIWLFSAVEVFGHQPLTESFSADEGTQYAGFPTAESAKKRLANGSGNFSSWWFRSPTIAENYYKSFGIQTGAMGGIGITGQTGSFGVCFGFCV